MLDLAEITPTPAPETTRVGRRILDTADELFYRRGITAVGVDMLAEHAGTTKRTLYQRFGSKDGLISAYLQQRAHRWQTQLLGALRESQESRESPTAPDPLAVVFATAERMALTSTRGCGFVNAWAELGTSDCGAVDTVRAEKLWMLDLFGRICGDDDLAAHIHLIYEGAQVRASILGDPEAFRRAHSACCLLLAQKRADGEQPQPAGHGSVNSPTSA